MRISDIQRSMITDFSKAASNFSEESVKQAAAKSRQGGQGFDSNSLVRGAQANGTATQEDLKANPGFKRDAKMDAAIAAKTGQDPAKGDLNQPATAPKDTTGEAKQSEATSETKETKTATPAKKLSYAEQRVQDSQAQRKKEAERLAAEAAKKAQEEEAFQTAAQTGGGVQEIDSDA
jgi:hypothetical protein